MKRNQTMSNREIVFDYLNKATIYEVNLRQYSRNGDIKSFQYHLPRLKSMGVDIIWLMPIHPIGIKNRKGEVGSPYSCMDFFDLNADFGTKNDFKKLVDNIHALGMKIIIDWVANHASWDNKWTETNPEYFEKDTEGNFLSPYDWTDVIQIDHSNIEAHDAMRNAMLYWVREFDIDGFRADMAHLTPLYFWVKCREQLDQIKSNLIWLGETEDRHYFEAFDIIYGWKWMHKSAAFVQQHSSISVLIDFIKQNQQSLPSNSLELFFTSNHDENSWNGTEYEKYGVYSKAFAVLSFLLPFAVPLIYGGQELPNPKRLLFFDKDEIEWKDEMELFSFYQKLAHQRKYGKADHTLHFMDTHEKVLAFKRGNDKEHLFLFLNLDQHDIHIDYALDIENSGYYFNAFTGVVQFIQQALVVKLLPGEFLLLEKINKNSLND